MPRKKPIVRRLSKNELADELGRAKAVKADAVDWEETIKDEIKRRRIKHAVGKLFKIVVIDVVKMILPKEKVEKKLGTAWVKRNCRPSEYKQIQCDSK